ncbi:MAG: EthD family reductase [Solirubrobacteraceae bacterium]
MTSRAGEAGQDRPTKISFVYSNPTDPAAFEAAYPEQVALARRLPGLTRLQTSRVWPKEDGTPTPAYRLLDLYFANYAAASDAVTTTEAGALVTATLEHATGGVAIAFAEVLDDGVVHV